MSGENKTPARETETREQRRSAVKEKAEELKERVKKKKDRLATVRKEIREAAKNPPQKKPEHNVVSNGLELLVTIVDRRKTEYYTDLIESLGSNMMLLSLAQGTADARMRGLLGITDSDKTVIWAVLSRDKLPEALKTLGEKFVSIKGGKGIAYTIPFTSVIGALIYGFLSGNKDMVKDKPKA